MQNKSDKLISLLKFVTCIFIPFLKAQCFVCGSGRRRASPRDLQQHEWLEGTQLPSDPAPGSLWDCPRCSPCPQDGGTAFLQASRQELGRISLSRTDLLTPVLFSFHSQVDQIYCSQSKYWFNPQGSASSKMSGVCRGGEGGAEEWQTLKQPF